jgi:hypothetical protein
MIPTNPSFQAEGSSLLPNKEKKATRKKETKKKSIEHQ